MDHETVATEDGSESEAALLEGYRQMAADQEQEKEAEEWTEALVGDILDGDSGILPAPEPE
jgi:hypothetical protein